MIDRRVLDEISARVPGVHTEAGRVRPHAHDASHFLLVPQALVVPRDVDEFAHTVRTARRHGVPLTLRSGGTSLSGQAVSDGLLVDTRKHFRGLDVLDEGRRVRVDPGTTVRAVNARLLRHGRKFGPDPASEVACTIGGVVANNSSGMLCGTTQNVYRTLESAVLVLPSGDVVDTGAGDADARLAAVAPDLARGLVDIRDRIRSRPDHVREIERQFSMKNTMGYGLNSFLDHDSPAELLAHLVVGSEGTLAFVASATFETVPALPHVSTALLVFESVHAATAALPALVSSGLGAIELMDAASLRVAATDPKSPELIRSLRVEEHAALLVEHQRTDPDELADAVEGTRVLLGRLPIVASVPFTSDAGVRAGMWAVRKGLYAAVAGARPSGTTALLEDIAVPVEDLADTCTALEGLFDRYDYPGSVIFGHAKDGNVHFLVNERFAERGRMGAYEAFTEDLVELVLGRGGTLKAEHGTGRIMAPFVERQYGAELYACMREVKRLVDPDGVMNPGVVITDDPGAHLRDIKTSPTVEEEVDRCVECGYCEPVCPSRDLTLTPRQRIVARREIAAAEERGDVELVAELRRTFEYDAVETCAVDGMCGTTCPVFINTGDLVRRLRGESATGAENAVWDAAAKGWGPMTRVASTALTVADRVPVAVVAGATTVGRAVIGADTMPAYSADLPGGGHVRRPRESQDPVAVLLPSCTATMFASPSGGPGAGSALLAVCERAGVPIRVPDGVDAMCCGTPWKSKGMHRGERTMSERVLTALWAATDSGRLPVVVDASSCTEGLTVMIEHAGERFPGLRTVDGVTFVAEQVLPRLTVRTRVPSLTLHPTCASTQLGSNVALTRIGEAVADEVHVPDAWGCCAFAGDRGMLHPELTASATEAEAAEVRLLDSAAHASCNRTCELGMTRATGKPYEHVLELLERATR